MWWTSSGFILWMPSPQQSPSPQRTVSLQRLRLRGSDCRLLWASPTGGFPSAGDWLSHHGSPTFDNEFVERESPLQRITCTGNGILSSILHLYSELNSHQVRHLPQWERFRRPGWDSQQDGHSLFFKKFLVSETTENSSPTQVVSRTRNTNQPRAHSSPSHQGRLRLQVKNVHNQLQTILEISMTDVLTWTLKLNSGCSSLHITSWTSSSS